jgi:hypothetical protein
MYSEACEAQGMTLADLLKKQAPVRVNYNISEISEGEQLHVSSDGIFTVTNDMTQEITVSYSTFHDGIAAGVTRSLDVQWVIDTYPQATVKFSGNDLFIQAGAFVQDHSYYDVFGLSHVELPDDCTNVKAMWDDVCTRVNEKYWKRYLACETLEEWQVELQVLTDAVVRRYERALRLYDANADAIEKEFGAKQVTEYGDLKDTSSQTKNATSNTTVSATPDQSINDSESYAGTTSNGSSNAGTTEHTRTGKITVTQVGGDSMLGAINDNVAKWHDIETELVDEYAHVFMSYIWS